MILQGWHHFRYMAASMESRREVIMTTKGRDMLRLFSNSYASSSSAKVPMLRRRAECLSFTLKAEKKFWSVNFKYTLLTHL